MIAQNETLSAVVLGLSLLPAGSYGGTTLGGLQKGVS